MAAQGSNDDCYFYYYSSCTKGDGCPFRHCQAALGTETVCSLWREGRCYRDNCKFRHMESRINRSSIPCYWENQPTGCCKPHCVFLHLRSRSAAAVNPESKRLILPVSTNSTPTNSVSKEIDAKDKAKSAITTTTPADNYSNHSDDVNLSPVEPFVVSFDEGEESDSESVSSTPMKSALSDSTYCATPAKRNLMENLSAVKPDETNFGIKTLEQIRMEKIHKESEHFYNSAYDIPVFNCATNPDITYKPENYPPESEFLLVSDRSMDTSLDNDSSLLSSETERDLRSRLLKRKSTPSYNDKNTVQPKKASFVQPSNENDFFNFKVKTLDEIRKERENKSETKRRKAALSDESVNLTSGDNSFSTDLGAAGTHSLRLNTAVKSVERMKLKRLSDESQTNHNAVPVLHPDESMKPENQSPDESMKPENQSQMILHTNKVQNSPDDKDKTEASKVKRKETDSVPAVRRSKFLKSGISSVISSSNGMHLHASNETLNSSVNGDGQIKKLRRPIIRRNMASDPLLSPSKPTESPNKNNDAHPSIRSLISPSTTPKSTASPVSPIRNNGSTPTIRSLASPPSTTLKPITLSKSPNGNSDTSSFLKKSFGSPPAITLKYTTASELSNGSSIRPFIRRSLISSPALKILKPLASTEAEDRNKVAVVSVIQDLALSAESKMPLSVSKRSVEKEMLSEKQCPLSSDISDTSNNKTLRSTSVDELESLLLSDADLALEDVGETSGKASEDLLLEIEQLLHS